MEKKWCMGVTGEYVEKFKRSKVSEMGIKEGEKKHWHKASALRVRGDLLLMSPWAHHEAWRV
jgi:hypothetical protein